MPSSVAIQLHQLTKQYPGSAGYAVDHLDLTIPEGEIVVLVGPSGCGKTTTLKMINRLIEPTGGHHRGQRRRRSTRCRCTSCGAASAT